VGWNSYRPATVWAGFETFAAPIVNFMSVCVFVSCRERISVSGMFTAVVNNTKRPCRDAGGFRVTDGGYDFHLFKREEIQCYRHAVKSVLKSAKKNDPRIQKMLEDAATEWATYACPDFQMWSSLAPTAKAQALIAWILCQTTKKLKKKRTAEEVLIGGIAGLLHWKLNVQKRHDDYSRAVSCARSVWFLMRREYREYQHDDGHETVTVNKVCLNRKVRLRSRHACQRIEAAITKQAGWFLETYEPQLYVAVAPLLNAPMQPWTPQEQL
jgi:hypothetical protein